MSDFLNQILGALSGGARGYAAEKTGDEDRALKQQQIAAMYGTKGFHFVLDDRDHQLHRVNSITGIDYGPTTPEEVGFGQSPQQAAGLTGAAQGASTPGAPPVSASPVPQSSGPSVPDNAPENRDAPPVPATPAIPGVPPGMARAASTIGSGVRGPVKAPVLGTPSFVDAKVAEQNALDAAKLENEKKSIATLAPIKATSDSLAVAKRYQAEKAAGPVRPFADTPEGIKAAADRAAAEAAAKGTTGTAPMAARAGQMGLALRAGGKLIPMHEQLGASGIPLGAQTAGETAAGENMLAHVPGAKEVANIGLVASGDYAVYKAGLPNFILGATHAISGARISQQQANFLAAGVELRKGDEKNPAVVSKKLDDMVDFMNSMRASLPNDLAAKEEAGIDPATMAILKAHGYGSAPNGTAYGMIQQVVPDFKPRNAGDHPPVTRPDASVSDLQAKRQAAIAALRAQGKSDMQITAILGEKP